VESGPDNGLAADVSAAQEATVTEVANGGIGTGMQTSVDLVILFAGLAGQHAAVAVGLAMRALLNRG
jgi:hypothetical protein